jgi:4-hydroxybenzoate polyprenyltransferase
MPVPAGPIRRQAGAIVRLMRCDEYTSFVVVTTLLGVASGGGVFGWRLLGVLLANWLAVGFMFMINDVEDAPDDALHPAKARRNPVSAGLLSARAGERASAAVALAAALLYGLLGAWPFVIGGTSLVVGHLYSWRRVRLKSIPVADLISHALMLAAFQFLAGLFTFAPSYDGPWKFPLAMIVAISLYGELFNELRDLECDRQAGVTHTASLLGPRVSHALALLLLAIGALSAVATLGFWLIPGWVRLVMLAALAVLLARSLRQAHAREGTTVDLHAPFHKPIEIAAAGGLLTWFVWPWLSGVVAPLTLRGLLGMLGLTL